MQKLLHLDKTIYQVILKGREEMACVLVVRDEGDTIRVYEEMVENITIMILMKMTYFCYP
jgi:hypothetical protein